MKERLRSVKETMRDLLPLGVVLGGCLGLSGLLYEANQVQSQERARLQEDAKSHLHLVYDMEAESNPWCVSARVDGADSAFGELDFGMDAGGVGVRLGDHEFYTLGYGKYAMKDTPNAQLEDFMGGSFEYRGDQYTVTPRYKAETVGTYSFSSEVDVLDVTRTCNNVEVVFK